MSLATLAKSARNQRNRLVIRTNELLRREFIPAKLGFLSIETSSICNLECRFCAYVKKQSPKVTMPNELFEDCVEQALELGYTRFGLTPCTGDVFMDKRLFDKLAHLQAHPRVEAFEFVTNLSIPRPEDVERMLDFGKLQHLTISCYGHDLESFVAITRSTEKVYRRFLGNLETLLGRAGSYPGHVELGFRSTKGAPRDDSSDMLKLLRAFRDAGIRVRTSRVYNNWGGYVSKEDVEGLAIDITGDTTFKHGACSLLFTSVQVMATGVVSGCTCRDVDAALWIGDLRETPLREVLSTSNAAYMGLIEEQQRGEFRAVCRTCDFYKSIYRNRSVYRRNRTRVQSLEDFKRQLDSRSGAAPV